MNKKALIALVAIVIAALGGGLYYKNYAAKNATPPSLQAATGLYQGSTATKATGFLKADKAKTGTDFKQTKKDKDNKDSTDKATLKFIAQAGGLSDVYSETDTSLDEITKNFKASAEGQEYMAGFYNVEDGLWKTTKQTYYGVDGITVITDTADLAHTAVPAGNTFVFVSNRDAELYGYKDSSVEPTTSYDFCTKAKEGWNSGVVRKDELYTSVSHCMDDVSAVWVKTAAYPLDKKFTKIYTEGGSEDALKAYRMSKFYMVWVNFSADQTPVETKQEVKATADTGTLGISNLKVRGSAVNADKTVSIVSKDVKFTWDATYDGDTIAQYTKNDRTGETLSYAWTLTADKATKPLWILTRGDGVESNDGVVDKDCFNPLYNASGNILAAGLEWTCNYVPLPGSITLAADTKYTFEVTAFDGKDSVKTSVAFTTEKAVVPKDSGKLSITGLQVLGAALNADGKVSIDPTKELVFRWMSTYSSDTIAQFTKKDRTGETLSYTWTVKDSAEKVLWALTQEYGKGTEGVTKDDATCFTQLYDASGNALSSGKDWTCNDTSLPGSIKLAADTEYTVEVTAFDGKDSVKSSVDFTTEKVAAPAEALKVDVKLDAKAAPATAIKQGDTDVSLATFDVSTNKDIATTKLQLTDLGAGLNTDITNIAILSGGKPLAEQKGPKFPLTLDVSTQILKGTPATLEVKADIAGTAIVGSTHKINLRLLDVSDGTTTTNLLPNVPGNEMTIILSDANAAKAAALALYKMKDSISNIKLTSADPYVVNPGDEFEINSYNITVANDGVKLASVAIGIEGGVDSLTEMSVFIDNSPIASHAKTDLDKSNFSASALSLTKGEHKIIVKGKVSSEAVVGTKITTNLRGIAFTDESNIPDQKLPTSAIINPRKFTATQIGKTIYFTTDKVDPTCNKFVIAKAPSTATASKYGLSYDALLVSSVLIGSEYGTYKLTLQVDCKNVTITEKPTTPLDIKDPATLPKAVENVIEVVLDPKSPSGVFPDGTDTLFMDAVMQTTAVLPFVNMEYLVVSAEGGTGSGKINGFQDLDSIHASIVIDGKEVGTAKVDQIVGEEESIKLSFSAPITVFRNKEVHIFLYGFIKGDGTAVEHVDNLVLKTIFFDDESRYSTPLEGGAIRIIKKTTADASFGADIFNVLDIILNLFR